MTNIALVVLDTLRKDAFDRHFDWLPGRRFENAWAPSHWTVPVHASLFTGRYASEAGVHAKNVTFDYPGVALAEKLSTAGYTTRAFCSNPNISPAFGFDRGFDEFSGGWRLKAFDSDIYHWDKFISKTKEEGPKRYIKAFWGCLRSDCDTIRSLRHGIDLQLRDYQMGWAKDDGAMAASRYVKQTEFGNQEFLFVNLMEAHAPYDPPYEYQTTTATSPGGLRATLTEPEADPEELRQGYDSAVRYLSDQYREIFDTLSASFDYIVTISDHGELLGERGQWEHLCGLDPELTHVPLVVSGDGLGGETSTAVSLLDVHATLLYLARLDRDNSRGKNLLDDPSGRPFLTEYHGLRDDHRETLEADGYDTTKLDIEWTGIVIPEDYYGYESVDGWREQGTTVVDDPRAELSTLRADLDIREVDDAAVELSDEARQQLEDLGYA